MNVAELTKHMKAPLKDDEAAVILTSGFRPSQPNVAAASNKRAPSAESNLAAAAPAAQPNVAAAPKKRSESKLKKKRHQHKPPQANPNIDDANMERKDTKVTFAASSGTIRLGASSSCVQNLEHADQKIDRAETRRNLWTEMAKCCVLNATNNESKSTTASKKKKPSTVYHLSFTEGVL
jgi:hypothetical protein